MSQRRGAAAEEQARRYLERHGLVTLAQNYRCRWGEIDLVMRDAQTLIFVEVRYRSGDDYGGAIASIDRRKQRRLARAALHYLQSHHAVETLARFDVVTSTLDEAGALRCEWLRNAFEVDA